MWLFKGGFFLAPQWHYDKNTKKNATFSLFNPIF